MISAQVLLPILQDKPYEITLADLDSPPTYFNIPRPLDNFNSFGTIIIEVAEGLLLVPYDQILLDHDWEQLMPDQARLVPLPAHWATIRDRYTQSLDDLEQSLIDALTPPPLAMP